MKATAKNDDSPGTFRQRCVRGLKRVVRGVVLAFVILAITLLVGLIPVNNDFQPTPDGIEILVISNSIHADIVLPIDTPAINWREHFSADCFSGDTSDASHVAIGWGDREFFVESPTWADIRVTTAARALFLPSVCCLHVSLTKDEYVRDDARSIAISVTQYERLVDHILASFQRGSDGSKIQIKDVAYGSNDAFFQANGCFHCFNTCNNWVGTALKSAGIRTGWYTPLPKSVFLYLPE